MKATDVGKAAQHVKSLIMARTRRKHIVHVEEMTVRVECDSGCCYDEIEMPISDEVRLAMLGEIDAEIAADVAALAALGVTDTDAIVPDDDHDGEDEDCDGAGKVAA